MKKLQALTIAAASLLVLSSDALAQAVPPSNAPVGGLLGLGILAAAVATGGFIALRKK
jgi:hypothetical protein